MTHFLSEIRCYRSWCHRFIGVPVFDVTEFDVNSSFLKKYTDWTLETSKVLMADGNSRVIELKGDLKTRLSKKESFESFFLLLLLF